MLNDKAQVMILLKEAAALDCLASALDIVTQHTRAGVPEWSRIRDAIAAMLLEAGQPRTAQRRSAG